MVQQIRTNIARLGEDGINNIMSIDRLSIDKLKKELAKHGDNGNNTTDATSDHMTELDATQKAEHVPPVQPENIYTNGDAGATKASPGEAVEYVVDEILDHDAVNGKKLYCVRWYLSNANDDTAEPAEHLSDNSTKSYCRLQNR